MPKSNLISKIRVRYAPSPTGDPHVGNVRTALFNYLFAKHEDGAFIVRVEDTDKAREVAGSEEKIREGLEWLGIETDESPWQEDGTSGPYHQSERLDIYKKHTRDLLFNGHAYYCFCSPERLANLRAEQEKSHQAPRYDRHCRTVDPEEAKKRAMEEAHVIRLAIPDHQDIVWDDLIKGQVAFHSDEIDDQVLLKSDSYPTYHLASVVDDHLMDISHVLRGEDWIPSTPKHILLYQAFGWTPPAFGHFPLILGAGKTKLSKRNGHTSLLYYKVEMGIHPMAMVHFMAFLGWTPEEVHDTYTYETLSKAFDLARVGVSPAVFDQARLDSLSHHYFGQMSDDDYYEYFMQWLSELPSSSSLAAKAKLLQEIHQSDPEFLLAAAGVAKLRTDHFNAAMTFLDGYFNNDALKQMHASDVTLDGRLSSQEAAAALGVIKKAIMGLPHTLPRTAFERIAFLGEYFRQNQPQDVSGQVYLHPARVAITGRRQSMNMFEYLAAYLLKPDGKEVILARLDHAIKLISHE